MLSKVKKLPSALLRLLVYVYRFTISPMLGNCCRFYPSCSEYAMEALQKHGACKGSFLTLKRILRCHPWNPGGVDLVP